MKDYYKLLKIKRTADSNEIFHSYLDITSTLVPPPGVHKEIMEKINNELKIYHEAANILLIKNERDKYDIRLQLSELINEEMEVLKQLNEMTANKTGFKSLFFKPKDNNSAALKNKLFNLKKIQNKLNEELELVEKEEAYQNNNNYGNTSGNFYNQQIFQLENNLYTQTINAKNAEMFSMAKAYLADGSFDYAIDILRELIESNPKEAIYHTYLGLTLLKKGWSGYAKAEFKVSLFYDPEEPIAVNYFKTLSEAEKVKTKSV